MVFAVIIIVTNRKFCTLRFIVLTHTRVLLHKCGHYFVAALYCNFTRSLFNEKHWKLTKQLIMLVNIMVINQAEFFQQKESVWRVFIVIITLVNFHVVYFAYKFFDFLDLSKKKTIINKILNHPANKGIFFNMDDCY